MSFLTYHGRNICPTNLANFLSCCYFLCLKKPWCIQLSKKNRKGHFTAKRNYFHFLKSVIVLKGHTFGCWECLKCVLDKLFQTTRAPIICVRWGSGDTANVCRNYCFFCFKVLPWIFNSVQLNEIWELLGRMDSNLSQFGERFFCIYFCCRVFNQGCSHPFTSKWCQYFQQQKTVFLSSSFS